MQHGIVCLIAVAVACLATTGVPHGAADACLADEPVADALVKLDDERRALDARLMRLDASADLKADARIYLKAVEWALRYESKLDVKDMTLVRQALRHARGRIDRLAEGKADWPARVGRLARGFLSAVDGSAQPYGLIVPVRYDGQRALRLDVVLHGSTRPTGMSELRFLSRFEEAGPAKNVPDSDFIELHPLGRVENGYRWAGETDVFEAIEAVARSYKIDRDRIVLRGMSMGASGTWHLGLKHPNRFVALGPYCGYVDTFHFSRTPLPNFIPVGPLPAHQRQTLHVLDSIDYAANGGVVPAIACMGELDVFFQAHVLMGQAMEKEGLKMVNLISPGTKHVIDPVTFKEQMRRIEEIADKGLDRLPRHLRFVTWTLKYGHCHWLQLLGLDRHYERAEFDGTFADDGLLDIKTVANIRRFAIDVAAWKNTRPRLRISGSTIDLPAGAGSQVILERRDDKWACKSEEPAKKPAEKRPGVQGPIDDAFTAPFLCVRGTGPAWHSGVQDGAAARLDRFLKEWSRYFRGDARVKDDREVTAEDARRYNLILFGDPGSNTWIAKAVPALPIGWTRAEVRVGQKSFEAAKHLPVLIAPSPWASDRYAVINSGHTFGEKELASLNYLLYPRLGDWAILRLGTAEEAVATGFFDEHWHVAQD